VSLPDSNQTISSIPAPSMLGKYKIVRVIARSNDTVFEAIDPGMNRRIAVKELALSTNLSGQQRRERIERFYREAKAAGNLAHPNIVTVHEVGQDGDRHYIAMEYLEGPSLRDILRMRGSLTTREALTVALELSEALGYAHSQGVVHRDVKPDNIHLIVPNDSVKLTDFGIARILSDPAITSTGQVFGTPSYMSPEQILSKEVDHRTDIFSVGVVLYEMIVGKKPFTGDSVITITYHVMNSHPQIPPTLPSGVYNMISRALAKDPNQRYQNMAALAADIHAELAFSNSPYHKTIQPGVLTANQLAEEQTAMIESGQLPRPGFVPPSSANKYAPATGLSEAVSGGPVAAAKSVTPYILPQAPAEQGSTRSALVLVGSIFGVMFVVLALVGVIAKAYVTSRVASEIRVATIDYNNGNIAALNHQFDTALTDYKAAIVQAPKGSQIASLAQTGVFAMENRQDTPAATVDTSSPVQPATQQITTDSSPAQTTTVATSGSTSDQQGQLDFSSGQAYWSSGDEQDAITKYQAAATEDPTGDAGKKAGSTLAQVYSAKADVAMHDGQTQDALDDWQLVVKYAPGDPLADTARQKILENAPGGQSQSGTGDGNNSSTAQGSDQSNQ
jgi:serine/threonine protein kinase